MKMMRKIASEVATRGGVGKGKGNPTEKQPDTQKGNLWPEQRLVVSK